MGSVGQGAVEDGHHSGRQRRLKMAATIYSCTSTPCHEFIDIELPISDQHTLMHIRVHASMHTRPFSLPTTETERVSTTSTIAV